MPRLVCTLAVHRYMCDELYKLNTAGKGLGGSSTHK